MSEQKQETSSSFSPELQAEAGLKRVFNPEQKSYFIRLKDEMRTIANGRTPQEMHAEKDLKSLKAWTERRRKAMNFLETKKIPAEEIELEFEIPKRSKRGELWPKSAENPHATKEPDTGYLLPEVELTPPEQAVKILEGMYPGLDTKNWEQALRIGIAPAMRACREIGIDPERLVIFPWIKRKALARLAGLAEGTHYGGLVERAIFPQLEKLYQKRKLGFTNYRRGKMSIDNYLQMEERTEKWLEQREEETEGDICFSAGIMDMFQGYSVDAVRYETEKEERIINGTSYVVQQILLTQTQLKMKWEELHWEMPGDRYDPNGNSRFSSSLCCAVAAHGFGFGSATTVNASTRYGSVVFLSETKK